jgi:hypothetical protein
MLQCILTVLQLRIIEQDRGVGSLEYCRRLLLELYAIWRICFASFVLLKKGSQDDLYFKTMLSVWVLPT